MAERTSVAKWIESEKRWRIAVQMDGERRWFSSSTPGLKGKKECHRKADEWLENGIERQYKNPNELYPEFLDSLKRRGGKSYWKKEDYNWQKFIKPEIGRKRFASIREQDLQDIIDLMSKKYSRGTIRGVKATINSFFKFGRMKNATQLFPENLSIPKSVRYKVRKILQPGALFTLLNVDTTILRGKKVFDEYIYAYRYEVLTGLRPGEIIGLQHKNINGAKVELTRSINVYGEQTDGKNQNALRTYTMSEMAMDVFLKQKELLPPKTPEDSVFGINALSSYEKRWRNYRRANNIGEITLYELRHTFISILKELPEGQVKTLVGHSIDMDTYGVYGHEVEGEAQNIAKAVNEIFMKIVPKKDDENS